MSAAGLDDPDADPDAGLPFEPAELEGSVFARFERVAERFPERDAVRQEGRATSYRELRESALRFASALGARMPRTDEPVALMLDAGPRLFSSMLGALASGRVYAPVDPRLPDARVEAILRELGPAAVVTDGESAARAARLAGSGTRVLAAEDWDGPAGPAGRVEPRGDDFAYVLFTSGSTSRPKGVVQSHRNVLHNVARLTRGVGIGPADRITLLSSPSFGASVSDVFGALLNGAAVCPFSLAGDGLRQLPAFLAREAITIYHSVPSVFRSLAWTLDGGEDLSRLRTIKLGGEPVLTADFELYRNRFSRRTVFHVGYGATEMNVMRQWLARHDTPWPGASPLGHPVGGVEIVLLDERGRETSGEGEIGVVSDSLAVAYWRDPQATAAAFAAVPGRPGVRMYRTGDLGRILPDGCLLHLGRRDARLKVRGHRVEASEVEGELLSLAGVREAAVDGREIEGGIRLLAWVAGDPRGDRLDGAALRRALARRLPAALVPSRVIVLDALPRTASGKVDRRALPDPAPDPRGFGRAPSGDAERAVMRAFARVLGVEAGPDDDFFDLGGDSLSAVALLVDLGRELGVEPSVADLLEDATPAGLAARAARASDAVPRSGGLVRLGGGGAPARTAGPPVFVVPGGGGDGEDLFVARRLALLAGEDRPFYCLRSGPPPHPPVDELAARWVSDLREVQPHGPYALVGDCVGGALAFAMAARLREEGEDVAPLVLLDAPFPGAARRVRSTVLRRASWLERLRRRAAYFAGRLRHHAGVVRAMPGGRLAYAWRMARVAGRGLAPPSGARERESLARRDAWSGALMAWTPPRLDAAICVVETEDGARRGSGRAWAELARDAEIVTVPGTHTGMILDHGNEVAAAMRRWLAAPAAMA